MDTRYSNILHEYLKTTFSTKLTSQELSFWTSLGGNCLKYWRRWNEAWNANKNHRGGKKKGKKDRSSESGIIFQFDQKNIEAGSRCSAGPLLLPRLVINAAHLRFFTASKALQPPFFHPFHPFENREWRTFATLEKREREGGLVGVLACVPLCVCCRFRPTAMRKASNEFRDFPLFLSPPPSLSVFCFDCTPGRSQMKTISSDPWFPRGSKEIRRLRRGRYKVGFNCSHQLLFFSLFES